jgi:hypothetical protein
MGKYEYVIDKDHPRANEDGQVYTHIIVAEEKLGRYLLPEEVVHHKDLNKLNNHPDNLMVFATKGDHTRFHKNGCQESTLSINSNGAYVCLDSKRVCVDCGATIARLSTRCRNCSDKYRRKFKRPDAVSLFSILTDYQGNFTKVAQDYGVTDNTVRKWCISYNLPYKSQDYKLN